MIDLPDLPPLPPMDLTLAEGEPGDGHYWRDQKMQAYAVEYGRLVQERGEADKEEYAAKAVETVVTFNARVLALQQASYEREIAIEVGIERERCAAICEADAAVYHKLAREDRDARHDHAEDAATECAAAIRSPRVNKETV